MKPSNMIFFISDEHARRCLGAYGHPLIKTPNLDRLAEQGVRFNNAYTPSPICVPTRAAIHTGQWVHQTGNWSSAEPYTGSVRSWAHRLREAGYHTASIGKLHFQSADNDHGFSEEIIPLHILNGVGWVQGLPRKEPLPFDDAADYAEQVGMGTSSYSDYDVRITETAVKWIEEKSPDDKPWVLFVSLVAPHFPLLCPEEFYAPYADLVIPGPEIMPDKPVAHPGQNFMSDYWNYQDYFDEETTIEARRCYFGLCSFLDHNIGQVLGALKASPHAQNTRTIYTSDHGDMLGNHGYWAKCFMYEDSAAVPLIISGPDVPKGQVVDSAVNLIDIYPTLLDGVGEALDAEDLKLPGKSLFEVMQGKHADRVGFSEYHDGGSDCGSFMLRDGPWKLVWWAEHRPQLFNLDKDPDELNDLAENPAYVDRLKACEEKLRAIVDPEEANRQAFEDQAKMIEHYGGRDKIAAFESFNYTPIKV